MVYRSVWAPSPWSIAFRPGVRSGIVAAMAAIVAGVLAVQMWTASELVTVDLAISRAEQQPARCELRVDDGGRVRTSNLACGGEGFGDWLSERIQWPALFQGGIRAADQLVAGVTTGEVTLPMNARGRAIIVAPSALFALLALIAAFLSLERLRAMESLTLDAARRELTATTRLLFRRRAPRVFSIHDASDLALEPRGLGWSFIFLVDREGRREIIARIPETNKAVAPFFEPLRERLQAYVDGTEPPEMSGV